ncbi:hypothetical protein AX15_003590 [Amanita polypyramis BW_CC]|nr:hypothetical protein AX15_003590 [Amanita polypyramis BW_CC]
MFYYISFLRPPPSQVQLSRPISLTPQIANDLRTEYYANEKDMFYSWHQIPITSNQASTQTKPKKLTIWRQSTAWKEIHVPPPLDARDGQLWRLVLSCSGRPSGTIELGSDELGSTPFPVSSMSIRFLHKMPKSAVPKQEKIERVYTFPLPPREGGNGSSTPLEGALGASIKSPDRPRAVIKVMEQTSFDLDKVGRGDLCRHPFTAVLILRLCFPRLESMGQRHRTELMASQSR